MPRHPRAREIGGARHPTRRTWRLAPPPGHPHRSLAVLCLGAGIDPRRSLPRPWHHFEVFSRTLDHPEPTLHRVLVSSRLPSVSRGFLTCPPGQPPDWVFVAEQGPALPDGWTRMPAPPKPGLRTTHSKPTPEQVSDGMSEPSDVPNPVTTPEPSDAPKPSTTSESSDPQPPTPNRPLPATRHPGPSAVPLAAPRSPVPPEETSHEAPSHTPRDQNAVSYQTLKKPTAVHEVMARGHAEGSQWGGGAHGSTLLRRPARPDIPGYCAATAAGGAAPSRRGEISSSRARVRARRRRRRLAALSRGLKESPPIGASPARLPF